MENNNLDGANTSGSIGTTTYDEDILGSGRNRFGAEALRNAGSRYPSNTSAENIGSTQRGGSSMNLSGSTPFGDEQDNTHMQKGLTGTIKTLEGKLGGKFSGKVEHLISDTPMFNNNMMTLKNTLLDMTDQVEDYITHRPLKAMLGGVMAGWLIGKIIR